MSQLTQVYVSVNRAEAIRRGINGTDSPVLVPIDVAALDQADRDEIAVRLAVVAGHGYVRAAHTSDYAPGIHVVTNTDRRLIRDAGHEWSVEVPICLLSVVEPSQAGVVAALADDRAKCEAHNAKLVTKRQAEWDAAHAVVLARKIETYRQHVDGHECDVSWTTGTSYMAERIDWQGRHCTHYDSPEYQVLLAEIAVANKSAKAKSLSDAQAEREAAEVERDAWIGAHGSDRLRRLRNERIPHDKTYATERATWQAQQDADALAAERPGWHYIDVERLGKPQDIADVGMRSLALLDAARKLDPTAKLGKVDGKIVAVATFRGRLIGWPRD